MSSAKRNQTKVWKSQDSLDKPKSAIRPAYQFSNDSKTKSQAITQEINKTKSEMAKQQEKQNVKTSEGQKNRLKLEKRIEVLEKKLDDMEEGASVRDAHCNYNVDLFHRIEERLQKLEQVIAGEYENSRNENVYVRIENLSRTLGTRLENFEKMMEGKIERQISQINDQIARKYSRFEQTEKKLEKIIDEHIQDICSKQIAHLMNEFKGKLDKMEKMINDKTEVSASQYEVSDDRIEERIEKFENIFQGAKEKVNSSKTISLNHPSDLNSLMAKLDYINVQEKVLALEKDIVKESLLRLIAEM